MLDRPAAQALRTAAARGPAEYPTQNEELKIAKQPGTDRRHSVRIVGGCWRGRRIAIPRGTDVRPTPDRVRETVFNWLAASAVGANCLDLYAGTGALGFECLSRGARQAVFVERDPRLAAALRACGAALEASATVLETDAVKLLRSAPSSQFDIVFLDPPYACPLEPLLTALGPWTTDRARIYVERPQSRDAADELTPLAAALPGSTVSKRGKAGGVVFGVLERR